jgi:hypothetical protein
MRYRLAVAIAVAVLAVGIAAPAFAQDAHIGTWKQNFAKSTSTPPTTVPQPRSAVRTYEAFGDGLKFKAVTVSADGKTTTSTYAAHYDGKEYPLDGNANADTIILKKIDNRTFESILKKNGKITSTGTNAVSADGKTMTYTSKGTNAAGQAFTNVQVYEKQ